MYSEDICPKTLLPVGQTSSTTKELKHKTSRRLISISRRASEESGIKWRVVNWTAEGSQPRHSKRYAALTAQEQHQPRHHFSSLRSAMRRANNQSRDDSCDGYYQREYFTESESESEGTDDECANPISPWAGCAKLSARRRSAGRKERGQGFTWGTSISLADFDEAVRFSPEEFSSLHLCAETHRDSAVDFETLSQSSSRGELAEAWWRAGSRQSWGSQASWTSKLSWGRRKA